MGGKGFLSAHINCRQKYVVPCCETRKLAFNETTSACNQRTVVQLFFAKATGSTKGLLKKNTFKTKFEKKNFCRRSGRISAATGSPIAKDKATGK
jgi:hypothetical protein